MASKSTSVLNSVSHSSILNESDKQELLKYYSEDMVNYIENSLTNEIQYDSSHYGNIYFKSDSTTIKVEPETFLNIYNNEGEYSLKDVWEAYGKVPSIIKKEIDEIVLKDNDYDEGPHGSVTTEEGKTVLTLNQDLFNGNYKTKNTSFDLKQMLLHEGAHCMDSHFSKHFDSTSYDSPSDMSISSNKFQNISKNEIASYYSKGLKKDFEEGYSTEYLSENFAEALSIVATQKVYGNVKISDPRREVGDFYSNYNNDMGVFDTITYKKWKEVNPQLNRLCEQVLECNSFEDVTKLF